MDRLTVKRLHEQSQCVLHDYTVRMETTTKSLSKSTSFNEDSPEVLSTAENKSNFNRFEKLLLMLPVLHKVKNTTVEQIFFHDLIGSSAIRDIIGDIYRS